MGSHTAQNILYEKYSSILKKFLIKKYSQYYDIDDDVSEILIKIFLNINSFDCERGVFKSWVFSIAKNHMIDKWRTNTINVSVSNSISFSNNLEYNNTITTSNVYCIGNFNTNFITNTGQINLENCSDVTYLNSQISTTDNAFLNMKYVYGYDYCEIGKEFNLTSSTVSNRVNYIKTKLKKNNSCLIY